MTPDIIIRGAWVDWFLIYWATCYFGFFLVSWISMGLKPWYYEWTAYLNLVTRCVWLPILVPLKFYIHWTHRHDEPYVQPLPPELDEFAGERMNAWETYQERLGEIEVERVNARKQSGLGDGEADGRGSASV